MFRGEPAMLKTENVTFLEFLADVLQLTNSFILFLCMNLYTIQFFGVHRYRITGGNKKINMTSKRKVTAGTLNNRLERQKVEDKSSKFNEYNEFILVQGIDNLGLVEERPTELPGEPVKSENQKKK